MNLSIYLPNKEAQSVYYTKIKHDGHLTTRGKCSKHSPAARVFYISRVFSNVQRVLSECNTLSCLCGYCGLVDNICLDAFSFERTICFFFPCNCMSQIVVLVSLNLKERA